MRGHPWLMGILVVALGLPLVAAVGPDVPSIGAGMSTSAAVEPIRLYAPADAFVGHPIHLAVAVPDPATPHGFLAHQDLRVMVTLDGDVLFASDAVHEHDGFHPLVVTTNRPGTLRLWADLSSGDPTPMSNGTAIANVPRSGSWHDLEVQPAPVAERYGPHPYRDPFTVRMEGLAGVRLERTNHGPHFGANLDFFDTHGRLLMNAWPDDGDVSIRIDFPVAHMAGTMRALALSTPGASHTAFTETIEATFDNVTEGTLPPGWPDLVYPDCRDDVGLLVDPESSTASGLTFAEHADIRIHLPPTNQTIPATHNRAHDHDLRFSVHPIAAREASQWTTYAANLPAGNAAMTFHPPGPGMYSIFLEGTRVPNGCATPFVVLQEAQALAPGTLAADIDVDDAAAAVHLRAARDGTALTHYEFDTRVVRLHTDSESGRLVWKGKLHGHGGIAPFLVSSLEPGRYEVQVFPSPEAPGTAPVSADSPRGFVYPFTVESPPVVTRPPPAEPQAVPGPALLLVPLAVGLMVGALRRK